MRVSATSSIFSIVDNVRSSSKSRMEVRERAQAVSLKPLAKARGNGTMSILQNGLSGGRIRLKI
ncbi:MAG: hypothetical protein NE330_14045 [Lentisphaeraceae bacterium]|nr:hypothetical protein [Lentisphaeraceae bacterium]